MNVRFIVNWKFVAALGGSVAAIVAIARMDQQSIEKVSIHAVDSAKELVAACKAS